MGTQVLYPQDLLAHRFHVHTPSFHRRRNFSTDGDLTNLIVNRRPATYSSYKKTSPKPDKRKSNETKRVTPGGDARRKDSGGGMGQVKILRRGQSYDSLAANFDARSKSPPTKSAADDMAVLPKQIRTSPPPPLADVYAGSAFFMSPSPRAVPLPSFFNKKQQDCDPTTRDLRRLLRLE